MCLWAIYIFPGSVHIFSCSRIGRPIMNRSQTYEYGNCDCGRASPFLGIFVSNFWHCVFVVLCTSHGRVIGSPPIWDHAGVCIKWATWDEVRHDFVGTYINVWENVYCAQLIKWQIVRHFMLHGEFLQIGMIAANEKIGCKNSYKIFGETCYRRENRG